MPTTKGTKTRSKDVKKRSERLDMDRLVELARETNDDGTFYSHQEIADKMACSRVAVTRALQRIPPWVLKDRDVSTFKRDRADLFAMAQQLILQHITADKLKAASLQQLGTLFGIMYDKERLERGQATQHVAEISELKLDKDTMDLLKQAIQSRTKAILGKVNKQNQHYQIPAETSPSGDSEEDALVGTDDDEESDE
jgi:hypothetical protein